MYVGMAGLINVEDLLSVAMCEMCGDVLFLFITLLE